MRLPAFSACWAVECTCRRVGERRGTSETEPHPRGGTVPHETADRVGTDRSRVGEWDCGGSVDMRRILRPQQRVPWMGLEQRKQIFSWPRSPSVSMAGCASRASFAKGRNQAVAGEKSILALPGRFPQRGSQSGSLLSAFRDRSWQRYRIKDTTKGPQGMGSQMVDLLAKSGGGLPTRRQCLVVARNMLTGEEKYFVSLYS